MLIPHLHAYLTLDIRFIQVVLSVIKCANVMKIFFFCRSSLGISRDIFSLSVGGSLEAMKPMLYVQY